MSKKEKWEPPETALVYERSMMQEAQNRQKIAISEAELKIYDRLIDELFARMVDSDVKAETLKLKKQIDVLTNVRHYLRSVSV